MVLLQECLKDLMTLSEEWIDRVVKERAGKRVPRVKVKSGSVLLPLSYEGFK